jgi:hypothetical protein
MDSAALSGGQCCARFHNGDRDKEKHNRLLNDLLDVMLEHIEGLYGVAGNSILRDGENRHKRLLEDSIGGAGSLRGYGQYADLRLLWRTAARRAWAAAIAGNATRVESIICAAIRSRRAATTSERSGAASVFRASAQA